MATRRALFWMRPVFFGLLSYGAQIVRRLTWTGLIPPLHCWLKGSPSVINRTSFEFHNQSQEDVVLCQNVAIWRVYTRTNNLLARIFFVSLATCLANLSFCEVCVGQNHLHITYLRHHMSPHVYTKICRSSPLHKKAHQFSQKIEIILSKKRKKLKSTPSILNYQSSQHFQIHSNATLCYAPRYKLDVQ